MVSLIPRLSSYAVSGTPARSKVADLIHVLKYVLKSLPSTAYEPPSSFLRIDIIEQTPRIWTRLLKPGYTGELLELFNRYTIRYETFRRH